VHKPVLAILLAGAALSLSAQDVQFGVQGGIALPAADMSNKASLGLTAGGHARWDFSQGHGLMARADLNLFTSNGGNNVTALGVAADYTYHLERRPAGFYCLAGLNQESFRTSPDVGPSRSDSSFGIDLGAGYDLDRHLGFQGRYTTNSFNSLSYAALNLGVTYTF